LMNAACELPSAQDLKSIEVQRSGTERLFRG
jgi:hypothetical protein